MGSEPTDKTPAQAIDRDDDEPRFESERFGYVLDADGVRQDAVVHEGLIDDADREDAFALMTIRAHLERGGSLEDAIALFATPRLERALAEGPCDRAEIDRRLDEALKDFPA